jgi:penicillin-binding protein 1B
VKVKIPQTHRFNVTGKKAIIVAGIVCFAFLLVGATVVAYYWSKVGQIVDERLKHPLFTQTAKIYAAPPQVRPGQKLRPSEVERELEDAGYSVDGQGTASPMGTYAVNARAITIHPGPQSYHAQDGATISFSEEAVSEITGDNGQPLAAYELEPLLVTGLSDQNHAKRRMVTYDELPPYLVPAVTSIEDRHFFQHDGVDYGRVFGALLTDMRSRRYSQGFSTLTMQLAKDFFLSP